MTGSTAGDITALGSSKTGATLDAGAGADAAGFNDSTGLGLAVVVEVTASVSPVGVAPTGNAGVIVATGVLVAGVKNKGGLRAGFCWDDSAVP